MDASELERRLLDAAARGDRLAFSSAAERFGSLDEARALVRSRGVVRMVDRLVDVRYAVEFRDAGVVVADAATIVTATATGTNLNTSPSPEIVVVRADGDAATGPTMYGHFSVFNRWAEIDSWFEGNFMERIAPGAFKKTMRENGDEIRALFQHGHDPLIGDKPLGPIRELREDDTGAYYEVSLLDAPYVRDDVLPGLRAGLYGASFRFQTIREELDTDPDPSDENPRGLPERTLKELRLYEFGPVTFPAYPEATAGVRSHTDEQHDDAEPTPSPEDAGTEPHLATGAELSSHLRDAVENGHLGRAERRGRPALNRSKEYPIWLLPRSRN